MINLLNTDKVNPRVSTLPKVVLKELRAIPIVELRGYIIALVHQMLCKQVVRHNSNVLALAIYVSQFSELDLRVPAWSIEQACENTLRRNDSLHFIQLLKKGSILNEMTST
jgi:hypothetical protein